MATRQKTIQFTFDTLTGTVADATVTNLTQITLYIPETVIAFKSVYVDVGFMDIATSAATIDEFRVGLRLAAVAYSTITDTENIISSGENQGYLLSPYDFTSYFTTNWTGTSMTCDLQVYFDQSSGATLGMNNVTSIVTITYEYNDATGTNATQIKTAWIPLESTIDRLTTVADTEIGTNQIPILTSTGAMLPEASIVIRDYAFIIGDGCGNQESGTSDITLTVNIDAGSSFSFGTWEMALQTSRYFRGIWRPSPPDTTSVHAFQMWTDVANKATHLPILLMVTYEFDASSTSTVLNSIMMPIKIDTIIGRSADSQETHFTKDFYIEEPTTITLKQSGVKLNWFDKGTIGNLDVGIGSQVDRVYKPRGGVVASFKSLMHRIDSGADKGAGITIARGKNTLNGTFTNTDSAVDATNVTACLYLNYHSGLDSGGFGSHNHTVFKVMKQYNIDMVKYITVVDFAFDIPETNYYINDVGFQLNYISTNALNYAVSLDVQVLSGEGKGAGFYLIETSNCHGDNERAMVYNSYSGGHAFFRFPTDYDTNNRVNIETARDYRIFFAQASSAGLICFTTYHSITYTVADSVTGFSGTVTLGLHDASTGEKLSETSRSGDGAYSFTWYDDVEDVYVEANDGTNVGRSIDGTAS